MGKIQEHWQQVSSDLHIYNNDAAPIIMPTNFITVTQRKLFSDEVLWESFIRCFRDTFGRADVWGEGFICSKCKNIYPIETDLKICKCGGGLFEFYSDEHLRKRFLAELKPPSFCNLMVSPDNPKEVLGFSLGFIGDKNRICRYVHNDRHVKGSESQVKEILGDFDKILFMDELGIKSGSRGGTSIILLARPAFEEAYRQGVTSVLAWTSKKCPIYRICRTLGFEDILEYKGVVFIKLDDFTPVLKIMQNRDTHEFVKVLMETLRIDRGKLAKVG